MANPTTVNPEPSDEKVEGGYATCSKANLYAAAQAADIAGRSKMSAGELIAALEAHDTAARETDTPEATTPETDAPQPAAHEEPQVAEDDVEEEEETAEEEEETAEEEDEWGDGGADKILSFIEDVPAKGATLSPIEFVQWATTTAVAISESLAAEFPE